MFMDLSVDNGCGSVLHDAVVSNPSLLLGAELIADGHMRTVDWQGKLGRLRHRINKRQQTHGFRYVLFATILLTRH